MKFNSEVGENLNKETKEFVRENRKVLQLIVDFLPTQRESDGVRELKLYTFFDRLIDLADNGPISPGEECFLYSLVLFLDEIESLKITDKNYTDYMSFVFCDFFQGDEKGVFSHLERAALRFKELYGNSINMRLLRQLIHRAKMMNSASMRIFRPLTHRADIMHFTYDEEK